MGVVTRKQYTDKSKKSKNKSKGGERFPPVHYKADTPQS